MKRKNNKLLKVIIRKINHPPKIKRFKTITIDDICQILGTPDVIFTPFDQGVYVASRKDAEQNGEKINCFARCYSDGKWLIDTVYGDVIVGRFNHKTKKFEGLTDSQLSKYMLYESDIPMDEAV